MQCILDLLAVVFVSVGHADGAKENIANLADLDKLLAASFVEGHVPGASVAIVENGKVVLAKGYGYADVAKKIGATADTPFRVGSISKSFTAVAIMTLVEQGKLRLSDKLADFAPQVHFDNPWERTHPIRLVHLMEHTTGWPDIGTAVLAKDEKSWSTLKGVEFSSPGFVSRWQPGRFTVYNNAGPAVAALALEKASGKSYDQYMRDAVLRPLGMNDADFDLTPALAKTIARSYAPDGSETPYQYIVLKPAGALNISARELAQFVHFMLFDGLVDGRRILSHASIARIERSESNLASDAGFVYGYGLGNAAFPDSGLTFRGHNGGIDSFTAVAGYNRRCNCGYVLMANGGDGVDPFATPVAKMVQGYLTRGEKMVQMPGVKVDPATLRRYAGFYRNITPPNALLRPYAEILGVARVTVDEGHLRSGGTDYTPVSAQLFRRGDGEIPSIAFVEKDGEIYRLGAFDASEKEPLWLIALIFLTGALIALGAVVGLAMLFPWIWFWWRGALRDKGGILMRVAPLKAVGALTITMALPILAYTDSGATGMHNLAIVGWYSLLILVASVLVPFFAILGLVLAVRTSNAGILVRGYVIASSLGLIAVSAYLASIGWFALRTWTM
jgi:CubicO group peptidase (beta-lactamase class C family)